MINAGIPSWRAKVTAGSVVADPIVAPTELGGHGWAMYLADRTDTERGLEWVILDWCYLPDPDVSIEDKPLARDGGAQKAYKEVWFTFNDEYSWSQNSFEVVESRISKNKTTQRDDVLTSKKLLKILARDQMKDIFKKYNIKIE